jgi:hypothetical protein
MPVELFVMVNLLQFFDAVLKLRGKMSEIFEGWTIQNRALFAYKMESESS